MPDFELALDLTAECYACKAPREAEGKRIAHGDKTFIVEARAPCECGDKRVRVRFGISLG